MEFIIITCILLAIVLLYLYLIMPRITDRPDRTGFDGWLYAHRGFHDNEGDAPENSLQAFSNAIDYGYGIELDIQLSKDGVPVVFHDYTLNRVTGVDRKVSDLTLSELKQLRLCKSDQQIPTLEEVLQLVEGMVPLIIEFKVERLDLALCDKAIPLLDQYNGIYCMESFNPLVVRWFKKNRTAIMRGQLSDQFIKEKEKGNKIVLYGLAKLLFNFLGRPDFIAYNHKYASTFSLRVIKHLFKLPIAAWTVKNQYDHDNNRHHFDYIIFDSFTPFRRER
ncbi:MAG: glycerophosphodiester phosphodiesterase family protein [bacterium]|nr:glycerophosphodiester phosphodiesterase family protein [bacterium]